MFVSMWKERERSREVGVLLEPIEWAIRLTRHLVTHEDGETRSCSMV